MEFANKFVGQIMTGSEFNEQIKGPFYKILAENLQHYDFKYKEGLNVDHLKFNPADACQPGGLYFTNETNLAFYLDYGTNVGFIEIPKDARVYIEPDKYKADKLVIMKIIKLSELKLWADPYWCKHAIELNLSALKYIQKPTYEICLSVCVSDGSLLEYVPQDHKTKEICQNAIEENGEALQFVPLEHKTKKLCRDAVSISGLALQFVPRKTRTKKICLEAVEQDGLALQFVPHKKRTSKICFAAIRENCHALQHVLVQTPEICLEAVRLNKSVIKYVLDKTPEIIQAAVCESAT